MALPYINLYIGDVKKDTHLLSPAAFGGYMRLLLFTMHESKPMRGEVRFTVPQLTKVFGTDNKEQTLAILTEIVNPQFGILDYEKLPDGVAFLRNRRMVREGAISQIRAEVGRKGGRARGKQNESKSGSKNENEVYEEMPADFEGTEEEWILKQIESKNQAKGGAAGEFPLEESKLKAKEEAKPLQNCNGNNNSNTNNSEEGVTGEETDAELPSSSPDLNPGASVLVIPELRTIWMRHRPGYQFDMNKDMKPLRLIGAAIGNAEGITPQTFNGVDRIKQIFEALVIWSNTHKLYKNFQLSQFENYFQTICANYSDQAQQPAGNSTVQNNMNTANDATNLIKGQHANQGRAQV